MFKMRQTVLFVDDDAFIRKLYTLYFEAHGYCVLTAQDGESGLRMLIRERPDALVTDRDMPDMDGLELVRRAKTVAPNIPRIVCSGRDDMASVALSLRNGACAFVPKQSPFLADLDAALTKAMRQTRRANCAREPERTYSRKTLPVPQVVS